MAFFRSEQMVLCNLILHQEYAFDCIVQLGYLGQVQFLETLQADPNPNRKFTSSIQRCTEIEATILHLQIEINKTDLHTVFYENADAEMPRETDLPDIERAVQHLNTVLSEVVSRCDALHNQRLSLYEHQQVLKAVDEFLTQNTDKKITSSDNNRENLIQDGRLPSEDLEASSPNEPNETGLQLITGSIPIQRFSAFEVMIWRLSRGKALVKRKEFELNADWAERSKEQPLKYAFMVAFIGVSLKQKILKVCQGFHAKVYYCASTHKERQKKLQQLQVELGNLKEVFEKTCEHKKRILSEACNEMFIWRAKIRKMQQVYFAMNNFEIMQEEQEQLDKYLQTDCWIPSRHLKSVRRALQRGSRIAAGHAATLIFPPLLLERRLPKHHHLRPPTYFQTNKFTHGFQKLVDSYGIASYREANPAPYTVITFPFLFAVMFGDIGHGLIMTTFACVLVWREEKIKRKQKASLKSNEIFDLLFAGRYIILLMGLFSIYTGIIYNDMLSRPLNIFGSSWRVNALSKDPQESNYICDPSDPSQYRGSPYVLGLDPIWNSVSLNGIKLNNSLKMKVAIILGVVHMMFGLSLSAWNAVVFHNKADFFLVFLPQIVFFTGLFFYLVILIFFKWAMYGGFNTGEYSTPCAPSILITFINMILFKHGDPPPQGCSSLMYNSQPVVQYILLILAFCSIPILLCGRPLHVWRQHRRIKHISDPQHREAFRNNALQNLRRSLVYSINYMEPDPYMTVDDSEEALSEVWIHQGIHTIECVLGSVSHTASYLRLWALSLAHNQLSHVLWRMVLSPSFHCQYNFVCSIFIFFIFAVFAALTVGILVVMEGLSAFLHTLRLHWVEFQSKFYGGLGEIFTPFRFQESRRKDSYP